MRFAPTLAAAALAAAGLTFIPSSAHAAEARPVALTDAIAWLNAQADDDGLLPGFDGTTPSVTVTADFAKSLAEIDPTATETYDVASTVADAAAAQLGEGTRASQVIAEGIWASSLEGPVDEDLAADLASHISDGTGTVEVPTTTYDAEWHPTTTYATTSVDAAATGRLLDETFNSYTGTDAQAWAVLALSVGDDPRFSDALHYLLEQQCGDGGFRSTFDAVDAASQSCADAAEDAPVEQTTSSPDATASAVIFLSALPSSPSVTDAIGRAVDWLVTHQGADGGFVEPSTYGDYASANSVGLAARALRIADADGAALKAAALLRRQQVTPIAGCASGRAVDRGAVIYTPENHEAVLSGGMDAADVGSAVSVTTQSLAGLAVLPSTNPAPVLTVAPTTVLPGARATVTLAGANVGDSVCVVANGHGTLVAPGTVTTAVTAPRGVAATAITAQTGTGAKSVTTLRINTATSLKVTAARKVKRGKRLAVTVKGLWPSEHITVKVGKVVLGRATADAAGTAVVRGKVAKRLHPGKKKVVATGAFANRTGARMVKVTR